MRCGTGKQTARRQLPVRVAEAEERVTDRLVADYELESPHPLEKAAAVIAGEQSSGTFVKLPGETEGLVALSGARVESIEETGSSVTPSLPCRIESSRYTRGRIRLSWPLDNMGPSLTNTLATVAGNLFELAEVSALRLLDVEFPEAFRQSLSWAGLRHRRYATPGGRRTWAAHRHDRQAECRPVAGRDGGTGSRARARRHRLYQGRRIAGQRPALPARRAGEGGDGRA